MNHYFLKGIIVLAAIAAGWWLAGGVAGGPDINEPTPSPRQRASAATSASEDPASIGSRPWSGPMIPLEEFQGVHTISRGSPALNVEHLWQDESDRYLLFQNEHAFETLTDWLALKSSERETLKRILEQAAQRQLDWERENIKSEQREAMKYVVRWREPGTAATAALENELREAFGETLGRSIWIRGDLGRFFEPVPGWKRRGIEEIEFQLIPLLTGRNITASLTHGDFTGTWRLPPDDPESHFPLRLRHIFDVKQAIAKVVEALPQKPAGMDYPIAEWARPGFVKSPFSAELIDVRKLPAGMLVRDPTMPPDSDPFFRIPPEE